MTPVELLEEMKELLALNGENVFKVRAFERAALAVAEHPDLQARAQAGTLTELEGIGKGIAAVLTEFLLQGTTTERDNLRAKLPPGMWALTRLPGLGPKKAKQVIEVLGVTSVGELEYACRENRLVNLKGFGEKAQAKILEGIQVARTYEGQVRLGDALPWAVKFFPPLVVAFKGLRVSETGALRRRLEVFNRLDFLIECTSTAPEAQLREKAKSFLAAFPDPSAVPVEFHFAPTSRFGYELARTTAAPEHWAALGAPVPFDAQDEEAFFKKLSLPWIPPEMRETGAEVALAKSGKLEELLPWNGIQGIFHNHTTRSDGSGTLEEMVEGAQTRGYKYIGISDHSQSAFYAQGLKLPELLDQEKEIRRVQEKFPDIRVFWGIESDILADGSLDYEPQVLKKFDFVIASVHSRFQMDRAAMTQRLLKAVRNPATRFLGHVTGRLLLGRKGYDCDVDAVLREAAQHDVAVEINAHPARLDLDWRWGKLVREYGTRVSVNPDAHEVTGLDDAVYGVAMARKGLIPRRQVVNTATAADVARWLRRG